MTQSLEYQSAAHAVRQFQEGDRSGFLSLYETVFDDDRSVDWFHWKYEANPYVDHVPIVVATFDGEVVGCRSFFGLEMRVGDETRLALQPCDTMVHPDHRRRGLFTRMNELALERYTDSEQSFCFNFPNDKSKRGNEKLGWRPVGTVPIRYRLQNPVGAAKTWANTDRARADGEGRFAGPSSLSARAEPIERALSETVTRTHRACDRLFAPSSDSDVRIERHETPPVATLEHVYRRSIPAEVHAERTERFYRWRLSNPAQEYATYLATRGGEPVAAMVVSPVDDHVRIVDALPRDVESAREELERLLVAVCTDYANRRYVTAFGDVLPEALRYRFYPDTRLPLSALMSRSARTLYARDLEPESDLERSSIADWTLSRLELDTA